MGVLMLVLLLLASRNGSGNEEIPPTSSPRGSVDKPQSLFIIRHGARWDYAHPEWLETATRKGDPPLSPLGHQQARETGMFLDTILSREGYTSKDITWLSSPFLRCMQTSNDMLNQMTRIRGSEAVMINPECSVWEIDLDGSDAPLCLPSLQERQCYFPRLDTSYKSLFIPPIPEHKSEFQSRCDRAMVEFNRRFPYRPGTAIVIVTHAAGCLCLTRAAAQVKLSDVNAAGPCGVFHLTRSSPTDRKWELDHWSQEGGMNGYVAHISDPGQSTVPWHHMGPNGEYTGPPS